MRQHSNFRMCGRTPRGWKSGWVIVLALGVERLPAQTAQEALSASRPEESPLVEQLEKRPGDGYLWFELGVVRVRLGETDAAIGAFQHAATLSTAKLAAYRNVVALAIETKNFSLASATCKQALVRYPKDVELLQNFAYVLMQSGEFKEARMPLTTLKEVRPSDVAVRISLILALQKSGDAAGGEAELRGLLGESLLSREQALALTGEFEQRHQSSAAQETNAYVEQRWPSHPAGESDARRTPQASEMAGSATAGRENSSALSATIEKGRALIESEHYVEAMQFLVSARAEFPNQPELDYESALTDVCLQRYTEALARLRGIKQQGWDSAKVEFLVGGASEISGELKDAESAYRAAIEADAGNFMYYRALGALLQKEGTYGESAESLHKAIALRPNDSGTLILLAKCHEKAGDVDGAISLLEHAVESDPGSRRAHALLAILYSKRNRVSDAEKQQAIAATLEDRAIEQWTIWDAAPQVKN